MDARALLQQPQQQEEGAEANPFLQRLFSQDMINLMKKNVEIILVTDKKDLQAFCMKEFFTPIFDYMQLLTIDPNTNRGGGARGYRGLLDLIQQTRTTVSNQRNFLQTNLLFSALNRLQNNIHTYITTYRPQFVNLENEKIRQARAEVSAAELKKCYDYCCIFACMGWCPVENLLTLCNCCWAIPPRHEMDPIFCAAECTTPYTRGGAGRLSLWAPCGSIESLRQDIQNQEARVERNRPLAQKMF